MNFDVATVLLIGSIALILGLAVTVAYKVRVRGEHIDPGTVYRVGKLLAMVCLIGIVFAFGIQLERDDRTSRWLVTGVMGVVIAVYVLVVRRPQ